MSSKNRIEAALGKRLRVDIIPEVEKIHKVFWYSWISFPFICLG